MKTETTPATELMVRNVSIRDRLQAALRTGNNKAVDLVVADWLQGLRTDEELVRDYEDTQESYGTMPGGDS